MMKSKQTPSIVTHKPFTDFVIIGGGLVGALLALMLAQRDYQVCLIERKKASPPHALSPLDTRALALNYGTLILLQNWGFADLLQQAHWIKQIHVSDKGHRGIVHIDAIEEGLPYLGAVVPFEQLVFLLQQKVAQDMRIRFLEETIEQFTEQEDQIEIQLKSGQLLTSKILIGADGGESTLRKMLNIPLSEYDYHSTALIGKVRVHKQQSDFAFERFTTKGPIALLPAGDHLYTLVWVQHNESEIEAHAPDFLKQLQNAFGYRAGIFIEQGIMKRYPLKRLEAEHSHKGRIGLLGNAAHMLHPVAGQGFNLAVRDLLTFLEVVDMQQTLDADLWNDYQQRAQFQQQTIKRLTHAFVKGFETDQPFLGWGRNLLLQGFEWSGRGRTWLNNLMVGRS